MTAPGAAADGDRFLATVLVTDIVGSTSIASHLGDRAWNGLLDEHDAVVRAAIERFGGSEVKSTGDGFVALFGAPASAVRCGMAVASDVRRLGLEVRSGVHTGECESRDGDLGGIGIHIAVRVGGLAQAGEVLVSSTVRDLVTGSGVGFSPRGAHTLRGVPGTWRLYAATSADDSADTGGRRGDGGGPAASVTGRLRVLLVDDHPLWRQTLRTVLEHSRLASAVLEAGTTDDAVRVAVEHTPDVVVMDVGLPGPGGIEATRAIVAAQADARVLVLSSDDDPARVVAALRAGASGYMLKTARSQDIVDGVRRVAAGALVFPPELTGVVRAELRGARAAEPLDALTDRELEVLSMMAAGHSNQAIGEQLHLSAKTVETHVGAVFGKLGLEATPDAHRRVRAVLLFLRTHRPGTPAGRA